MTRRSKKTSDALKILESMEGNDPKLKALIAQETVNLQIARKIYEIRTKAGLSQAELAKRIGITQSVISRLEDADYQGHSLPMLQRIAAALESRIELRWVPLRRKQAA